MSLNLILKETASAVARPSAGMIELRQLRHQTKNALQRILLQVLEISGLDGNRQREDIGRNVMRQIELTATISDALFGFRQSPEPLQARLKSLAQSVIALHADRTQHIELDIAVSGDGRISGNRNDTILRIAHELVMNAVKHGMYMRLVGRITVRLDIWDGGGVLLAIGNDGWWMPALPRHGDGLEIVEELVAAESGNMRIAIRPQSLVEVRLPPENPSPAGENSRCQR